MQICKIFSFGKDVGHRNMWNQTEVKSDPVKDREGMVAKAGTGNTAFYRNYIERWRGSHILHNYSS